MRQFPVSRTFLMIVTFVIFMGQNHILAFYYSSVILLLPLVEILLLYKMEHRTTKHIVIVA